MNKTSALIPAAGRGERFGKQTNKVFSIIAGKPILAHTLSVFEACESVEEVIVVIGEHEIEAAGEIVGRFGHGKVRKIVSGGSHRQDSVRNGLREVTCDIVAIHDAARPMVTPEIIEESIREAAAGGACIVAVPVIDTDQVRLARSPDHRHNGPLEPLCRADPTDFSHGSYPPRVRARLRGWRLRNR